MSSLQRQLNRLFDDALVPANWDDFNNFSRWKDLVRAGDRKF